jgi:hypothetical protein
MSPGQSEWLTLELSGTAGAPPAKLSFGKPSYHNFRKRAAMILYMARHTARLNLFARGESSRHAHAQHGAARKAWANASQARKAICPRFSHNVN